MIRLNAVDPAGDGGSTREARAAVTARLSELLDHPPAVLLTGSCTHALEAAALLSGVGPGDEVVVPAFTFPSTATAFLLRGATVRFADIREHDGNVDPESVATRLSDRTEVVVAVHYAGVPADVAALSQLASTVGASLVEDAAHGLHTRVAGRPLGRAGAFACFSFHRTKNVTAGDGGALVVNDPDQVAAAQAAIDKGTDRAAFEAGLVPAYDWTGLGSAWHLPDSALPTLDASLRAAGEVQAVRRRVWDRYRTELSSWADSVGARLPEVPADVEHPAHIFWIRLPDGWDRDAIAAVCRGQEVEVARHFGALPASPYGRTIAHPEDACPVAQRFAEQLLRLPLHHQLTDADVDRVLEVITALPHA